MPEQWHVVAFESGHNKPVEDFLRSLTPRTKLFAKVARTIDMLKYEGPNLRMPHARTIVGYEFRELRIQFASDIVRIFFVIIPGQRIVLLHGFVKKSQKTPRNELALAQGRLQALRQQEQEEKAT